MATSIQSSDQGVTLRTASPTTQPLAPTSKPAKVDFDNILLGVTGATVLILWCLIIGKLAFMTTSLPIP
jgi:hypothetical protein